MVLGIEQTKGNWKEIEGRGREVEDRRRRESKENSRRKAEGTRKIEIRNSYKSGSSARNTVFLL